MDILVCIKQVADDSIDISFDASKDAINYNGAEQVVNAFDTYALEMAARLKEANEGEITVISVGPDSAKNALKNCLAVGAEKAALIPCEDYQEKDPKQIAQLLAKGIKDLEAERGGAFDLIFCGKESTDEASGQVGIMLAKALGYPVITNVIDIEKDGDAVKGKHQTDVGYDLIEAALPAIITVEKPKYEPRYPTVKSKMAARKKPIEELTPGDAQAHGYEVVKVYGPPKREAGVKIIAESAEDAVAQAMEHVHAAKVL
ncbi:electron transfer flavoprotein subunit beta/FixA family protein [Peptococcus simiae]|uniref:electron transfer flavoprotein subunit beta/FixA family protein n=1 Tax=Peptococcus simiae TaxID=1643805 RepID=UPI00397ECA00